MASCPGEWALLRALILDLSPSARVLLATTLGPEIFEHPVAAAIFRVAVERVTAGVSVDIPALVAECDDPRARRALAALEHEVPPLDAGSLQHLLRRPWERVWRRRIQEARRAHQEALRRDDRDEAHLLAERLNDLLHERRTRETLLASLGRQIAAASGAPGARAP
ncbi:MAG: hypothetical protein V1750_01530 [Acidobacteriota bacterium]